MSTLARTFARLRQLKWHSLRSTLTCCKVPERTYPGHAFTAVRALLANTLGRQPGRVVFHGTDIPLFRQPIRSGIEISLEVHLLGFDDAAAANWCRSFFDCVNDPSDSCFAVSSSTLPESVGFTDLPEPAVCDEWTLDFVSPMPFHRTNGEGRTILRPATLTGSIHRRLEALFGTRLPGMPAPETLELLPFYWQYAELRDHSALPGKPSVKSAARGKKGGAPHFRHMDGCIGPLLVRGELGSFMPWFMLAQALHAGGSVEINGLGHFKLIDHRCSLLDRKLEDARALTVLAESVLSRNDAALRYAKEKGGVVAPSDLANELAEAWSANQYRPEPYETFSVPKPAGGFRIVERPGLRDLAAQQFLNSILAPVLDNAFSDVSMAFRRGKSREDATRMVRERIATGYRFVVRADVEDFFPSVDHGRLLAALDRWLPRGDIKIRAALAAVVKAPFLRDGVPQPRHAGIGQGSPLSPLLANVYLDTLDRRLTEAGVTFVRYADDVVILTRSGTDSAEALVALERALAELDLRINPQKSHMVPVAEGFQFLGERFGGDEGGSSVPVLLPRRKPLIVTEPFLVFSVNGEALDLRRKGEIVATIPLREISEIVVLAKATFSTALLGRCARHRIPMSMALSSGYQIGTFTPDSRSYHEVAWQQGTRFRALSIQDRTAVAGEIAFAKIMNFISLVRGRYREGDYALIRRFESCAHQARCSSTNEQIRGHEGYAARLAYSWINREIAKSKQGAFCSARRDRAAPDRLNSMLNFGYYLLFTYINGLVRACGLNPYLGFLHESTEDFETLVCDIQEPFRVHVDRLVLRLVNRGEIGEGHFVSDQNRYRLTRDGIKRYAAGFETLFSEVHANITIRDSITLQVESMRYFLTEGRPLRIYRWNSGHENKESAVKGAGFGERGDPAVGQKLRVD